MYKSEVYGNGGIQAKVVADSIANGVRLTTMEVRFHRFILPEFNTHRMFSRNFSSSRAIPVKKMIEQVIHDPATPIHWGKNQPGMQAFEENPHGLVYMKEDSIFNAGSVSVGQAWDQMALHNANQAEMFDKAGYHKQIVNRLIEPFQFVRGVVTTTEWDNFFKLRDHFAAQPEIACLARCMKQAMEESEPDELEVGEWHLPYFTKEEWLNLVPMPTIKQIKNKEPVWEEALQIAIKCSAARCARSSYNKHDNTNPSIEDDLELYNQLAVRPYTDKRGTFYPENDPVHLSPLEHCATPMPLNVGQWPKWVDGVSHADRKGNFWSGNFKSWVQYRKLIELRGTNV